MHGSSDPPSFIILKKEGNVNKALYSKLGVSL